MIFNIFLHIFEPLLFLICKMRILSPAFSQISDPDIWKTCDSLILSLQTWLWFTISHIQNSKFSRTGQRGANSGYRWKPEYRDQLLQRPRLLRVVPETSASWGSKFNAFPISHEHCGAQNTYLLWNEVSNFEVYVPHERLGLLFPWKRNLKVEFSFLRTRGQCRRQPPSKRMPLVLSGPLDHDSLALAVLFWFLLVLWFKFQDDRVISSLMMACFCPLLGPKLPLAKPYKSQACQ